MNAGNRPRRSLTINRIQRDRIRKAEHEFAVGGGNESVDSLWRNRPRAPGIDGLHIYARFVAGFGAREHNAFAIRKKAGVGMVDGVMGDLLRFAGTKGNEQKLAGNVQGE